MNRSIIAISLSLALSPLPGLAGEADVEKVEIVKAAHAIGQGVQVVFMEIGQGVGDFVVEGL